MGFSGDTIVLMHDGDTKKIKNVRVGDELASPDGNAVIVTEIEKTQKEMYHVYPVKGSPYTISADHKLMLKTSHTSAIYLNKLKTSYIIDWIEKFHRLRKSFSLKKFGSKKRAFVAVKNFLKNEIPSRSDHTQNGDILKIPVEDFCDLSNKMQRLYKGFSLGIDFEEKNMEFDPYVLGYWLGDGTSRDTGITTAEPEIVEYFENFAEEHGLIFKNQGKNKYAYRVSSGQHGGSPGRNPFMNFLKSQNLIYNKHIPDDYKFNSREVRLEVLAGLVDSDGYYGNGCYEFTFKSEKLADDIIFLSRSLGFKAEKRKVKKTCTNSSCGRVTGTYYRFFIYGEGLHKVISRLDRKMASKRKQIKNASVTGLTILWNGIKDCYELKTNSNSLLLLDDFTIVHK